MTGYKQLQGIHYFEDANSEPIYNGNNVVGYSFVYIWGPDVKSIRESLGLTQERLAWECGCFDAKGRYERLWGQSAIHCIERAVPRRIRSWQFAALRNAIRHLQKTRRRSKNDRCV